MAVPDYPDKIPFISKVGASPVVNRTGLGVKVVTLLIILSLSPSLQLMAGEIKVSAGDDQSVNLSGAFEYVVDFGVAEPFFEQLDF